MDKIENIEVYNSGMAKSMEDKLFFLPIIGNEINSFTDFGCADGTLLKIISGILPECKLRGIDMDSRMLQLAEENVPNAELFLSETPINCDFYDGKSVLNLSSVLHEVNSYSEDEEAFWNCIKNSGYSYITIRDMIYNEAEDEESKKYNLGEMSSEELICEQLNWKKEGRLTTKKMLREFEAIWGSVNLKKNLMHYLLKYRYVQNWQREVHENYLGYSTDDIIKNVGYNYRLIYRKDYILPFLYNKVNEDFGIQIDTPTHTNLIFKRR
jgi:hypothetical protein